MGENAEPLDVGSIIDESPWTTFQKLVLGVVSLAFIVDSLANNVLSISIPSMIRDWHVHRAAFSSVVAMGWVGVTIGAVVAGSLADIFGRKTLLLLSVLTFGLATAAGMLVADIHQLLVLRAIDGFGIGGAIPTATTLLAELTPTRRRSRAVIVGMICMPLGTFIGGIIGSTILPLLGWRYLFATNGALAVVVCLLLLLFVPESPRFLARKPRRRQELLRGLKKLKIVAPANVQWADSQTPSQKPSLVELFGPGRLGMTLALWAGFFFCFLASYTSLTWMPSLLASHGYSLTVSSLALSASGAGGIIASLIGTKLLERFGSRTAFIFPASAAVLSTAALMLIPLNPARSAMPVLLAYGLLGLSLNALTCFVYALGAHVYPSPVRGTGLGAAGAVGRLGAFTSSYSAVSVLAVNSQTYFGFIAITAVLSVGFLAVIKAQIPSDKTFDADRLAFRPQP